MPWARTDGLAERVKFVAAYLRSKDSFTDLCQDFGVSRKTGYKWIGRYEREGARALEDRSRAPHRHPQATPQHVVEAIILLRRHHPRWGWSGPIPRTAGYDRVSGVMA